jgi:hypothetical protein
MSGNPALSTSPSVLLKWSTPGTKFSRSTLTSSQQRFSESYRQDRSFSAASSQRQANRYGIPVTAAHDPRFTPYLAKLAMNTQRLGQRLGRQLRSPAFRSTFQRRFASEKTEMRGVADNAFNRERAAVKAHAAATSGMYSLSPHV